MRFNCYDIVSSLTDVATLQFGRGFSENRERKAWLASFCETVDMLVDELGGGSIVAEVDSDTKQITVSIECREFQIENDGCSVLFTLLEMSDAFVAAPSEAEDDMIKIGFVTDGIWTKNDN